MAIKANIVVDQGSDFTSVIDLADAEGNVYDLTDHIASAQMRKNYASTVAYDFVCTVSAPNGQIYLDMSKDVTNDIEPGRYMYDVEITSLNGAGRTTRVVEGIATVTPGITRV